MRGVNKVIIVGNLGADPEVRQFDNGGSVTNISVATSEQWTDKQTGERREATEWHRISLFNRLGEVAAQYLRKGSQVYIEGSLRTRKWQDQNGQDRYITEIRADNMQMLGGAGGNQGNVYGGNPSSNMQNGGFGGYGNAQGGQNNQAPQGGGQMGYQNTPPAAYNNQGNNSSNQNSFQNNTSANSFNNQTSQPNTNPAGSNNNNNAMPDTPVDDDIPF